MIDAKHIIAGVVARDKHEGEIIIETSRQAFGTKDLEREFNDRSDELFPNEGLIWDGWKSIGDKDNVMKIFYTTEPEKKELKEYKERRKYEIESRLQLSDSVLSDEEKDEIITKLFSFANDAMEIVDEERGRLVLGRKVMEMLKNYS